VDEAREQGDFEIGYLCLFCGREVAEDAADFCELNFSTVAGFGTFTCHVGCLRERAHEPENFPDIETPREPPPGYQPPPQELVAAWDELEEVLGQISEAELDDADQVRSVMRAIEDAAIKHGVVIEHEPDGQ
jgi:hypothetical protein